MLALLSMLLPALTPVVADGARAIFGKITGGAGAQPQNVDEQIKLMAAETDRLKALAELDRPTGEISKWVANLRASFRYIAAAVVILVACVAIFIPGLDKGYVEMIWTASGSVWAFIFGDRMLQGLKKK